MRVGDAAPDFALRDQEGKLVTLSAFRGVKSVVLFFYPKDYTPVCTLETIAFREAYEDFARVGAEVLGVSQDSPVSHVNFCTFLNLPFKLLTDPKHEVRDLYGARGVMGSNASRVTYVIDRAGIIRSTFTWSFRPSRHAKEALAVAQTLQA